MQFQGDEPGEQSGREKLPDDGFQRRQASGERMQRHDIPVPGSRERHQAEVQQAPSVEHRVGIQTAGPPEKASGAATVSSP